MEPCQACPVNTYSDQIGSTECTLCRDGTGTPNRGANNYEMCEGRLNRVKY